MVKQNGKKATLTCVKCWQVFGAVSPDAWWMFNTTTLYSSASSERVRSHYKTHHMINSSKLFGRRILLDGNSTLILQMHNRDCDRRTSNPCDCCRMWVLQHYSRERSRDFSILSIFIRLKINLQKKLLLYWLTFTWFAGRALYGVGTK